MPAKLVPWVVMMPEGFSPQDCYTCTIKCAPISGLHYPCINPACPLATAKKAVEIKTFKTREGAAYTGRPVTLWATELEEEK